jgi:hypothetical protein
MGNKMEVIMITGIKITRLLMLGSVLLFPLLTIASASRAVTPESTDTILIEYQDGSFSVQTLTVIVGTTVTWRNNSDTSLNLRGVAYQSITYLPLITTAGSGGIVQQTSEKWMGRAEPASPADGFETIIVPGGEFNYRINTAGRFQFMDLESPDVRGQVIVIPLTKIYHGGDGSALYIRTVGNSVYGFGEHPGQNYAYALHGLLGDNHISATFWDIPKGTRTESGDVLLNVSSDGSHLTLESGSTTIGTDSWEEIAPGSFPWPVMQPAGFQEIVPDDLTGAFEGPDGSRHYIREVHDADHTVIWVGEAATSQPFGRPQWVSVFFGKRAPVVINVGGVPTVFDISGGMVDVPKGEQNATSYYAAKTIVYRDLWLWGARTTGLKPDYEVDWDLFESSIRDDLDGKATGYAYAIGKDEALMRSGADGYRLLSQDGGPEAFTDHTFAQAFSTSKTVTAVALVRALHNRGLSVDDEVGPFLPSCWTQGPGISDDVDFSDGNDNLKFRELLDHTSGLSKPNNADPYGVLRQLIASGRTGTPGEYSYNNTAYGLMRYLVPLVAHEAQAKGWFVTYDCETGGVDINRELSTMFSDYLFGMLDLVDASATFFEDGIPENPAQVDLAYLYNRNYELFPGLPPNEEGWLRAGAGYLATSVIDYRRFLGALDQGQILPQSLVQIMYNGNLGFESPAMGDAGPYYTKNGANTGLCGAGGTAQSMIYPSGINAYVMLNSATDDNSANWYYDYNHNVGASDEEVSGFGANGDLPFAGDFDHDGQVDDVGLYRSSTHTWYYDYNHNGGSPNEEVSGFGASGDLPIVGDFDRDGYADDVGVYRPSTHTWYYDYNHNGGTPDEVVAGFGASGDIPIAGDFDQDSFVDDVALYRPTTQTWYYDYDHNGGSPDDDVSGWGASHDLPIAGDFDRNGRLDDVAVYRPSNHNWYYDYDHNGGVPPDEEVLDWGASGDIPVAGDFDRDGQVDDVALYRPSTQTWYYDHNHNGGVRTDAAVNSWGLSGDLPIAGDFDRDGRIDDVAVYRPTNHTWYYDYDHDDSTPPDEEVSGFGASGDLPIAGDFDRDGYVDDVGVYRPSNHTWYYDYDHNGGAPDEVVAGWGASHDLPIVGDFNRDNYIDDVAVYRPSNHTWYYDFTHNGDTPDEVVSGWGGDCDIPIAGDFDQDGYVDDVAVYQPSTLDWYYDHNHNGAPADDVVSNWGEASDIPLAGDFDSDGRVDDVGVFRNTGVNLVSILKTAFDVALK